MNELFLVTDTGVMSPLCPQAGPWPEVLTVSSRENVLQGRLGDKTGGLHSGRGGGTMF